MAKADYEQLAREIIEGVGGTTNIEMITHCVTRLRFRLRDTEKANSEAVEKIHGVIQVIEAPGQYQVVVGPEVYDVYEAAIRVGTSWQQVDPSDLEDNEGVAKGAAGVLIDLISSIVAPTLGCLASTGMIKGLLALWDFIALQMTGEHITSTGTYITLYAIADGFIMFLPIMMGVTAARKFKMNEFVGASIGAAMSYPSITNLASMAFQGGEGVHHLFEGTIFQMSYVTTFLGIPLVTPASNSGYASTLVPVVLACWVSSHFYHFANDHFPSTIKLFAVPMFTLLVGGVLTFLIIGPVSSVLMNVISWLFLMIMNLPVIGGALGGALLGAIWQVLVIFGFHWALVPIKLSNIGIYYYDFALSGNYGCTWAQIACVLAVIIKSKDAGLRRKGLAAFITGLFGTTEPAIYGVTLPLRLPFVLSCVAGAVSGGFLGLMSTKSFMASYSGLLGLTGFIDARTPEQVAALAGRSMYLEPQGITHMIIAAVGVLIAFVVGFVLTWLFWQPRKE